MGVQPKEIQEVAIRQDKGQRAYYLLANVSILVRVKVQV